MSNTLELVPDDIDDKTHRAQDEEILAACSSINPTPVYILREVALLCDKLGKNLRIWRVADGFVEAHPEIGPILEKALQSRTLREIRLLSKLLVTPK